MEFLRKLFGGRSDEAEAPTPDDGQRLERLRNRMSAQQQEQASAPPRSQAEAAVPAVPVVPVGPLPRPIVLARKARVRECDWTNDPSWLGGLPRLDGAAWPRGKDGRPLPFAAQISLADVAAACPESPLPHDGWLAFFLNDGAVIHVAAGNHAETAAPDDLPLAYEEGGYPLPDQPSHVGRQLFPFWPVDLIGLNLPEEARDISDEERHEEIYELQDALLAQHAPGRAYSFSVYSARNAGIAGADDLWWYGAMWVGRKLRDALDNVERQVGLREKWIEQAQDYQARLLAADPVDQAKVDGSRDGEQRNRDAIPDIRRQGAELEAFVADFDGFIAGREPWATMSEEEIATLARLMKEARDRFSDLTTYHVPIRMDEVRDLCIRRMVTGDEQGLAALPDAMLDFINEGYRLTSQSPHQMFGLAGVKQDNLSAHLDDLLVLQLSYDDMNEWKFGDMGLWHYWISPQDAAASRWDKAQLTFECA